MTVNNAWKMCPDADVQYGGDLKWWVNYLNECKATGERWTCSPDAAHKFGLYWVRQIKKERGLQTKRWCVNSGGNSGFQAINLAWQKGARKIILVGFDMSRQNGAHFDGEHKPGMLSAPEGHIRAWRRHMKYLARDLRHSDVRVWNCSEFTELECFEKERLESLI